MKLRITIIIPLLLIILAIASSILVFTVSNRTAAITIRDESLARLNLDITRLQNILYNLLTENSEDTSAAKLYLSVTAMDPGFKTLLLANDINEVLMANYYMWAGKQAEQVSSYKTTIMQQVIQSNSPVNFFDEENNSLLTGYYPVVLQLESEQGLPVKRLGVLFAELSIEAKLNQAKINSTNQSIIFMVLMLTASLIIAVLLHLLVSMRLARLTNVAKKLTSGNLDVRTGIGGNDELTRLGQTFDDMVLRLKQDIIRREAAENELRELNESLEQHVEERTQELNKNKQQLFDTQAITHQANKMASLGEMASGIAHEINSPLQSISLFTYKLKSLAKDIKNDSIKNTSDRIDNAVNKITEIVESLRKMSRDSSSDPYSQVKISDIVNDVLSITTERYQLHGIKLNVIYHETVKDQTLECQQISISQIIVNLLNNAYDAVHDAEDKWIEISINGENDNISVTVTDSGQGIPLEQQSKIFEPMFTTKDIGKGTGLGLSISSEIARKHSGTLILDPESKHTRFVLTLPKKQEHINEH